MFIGMFIPNGFRHLQLLSCKINTKPIDKWFCINRTMVVHVILRIAVYQIGTPVACAWLPQISDAIWRHSPGSTLIRIMACRLFSSKPLPDATPTSCELGLQRINFSEIRNILIQENAVPNAVCKVATILFRPHDNTLGWSGNGSDSANP